MGGVCVFESDTFCFDSVRSGFVLAADYLLIRISSVFDFPGHFVSYRFSSALSLPDIAFHVAVGSLFRVCVPDVFQSHNVQLDYRKASFK